MKWHGIESLEKSKSKILDVIYAKDCDCEFDLDGDFKCSCRWHRKITLDEHKSFHDLRIVSKPRIHSLPEYGSFSYLSDLKSAICTGLRKSLP